MKALTLTRYGPPEVMQLRDAPDPAPGPGQLLIAIKRAGMNFTELAARVGLYPEAPKPPTVLGYEFSGTVAALGPQVGGFRVGDRVFGMTRFHGQATHVAVDAQLVRPLPEHMGFDAGAALPVNYLTAYHMLFHAGRLRPNDSVLIHMAGGGVGLALIELCRLVPGVQIFGTASAAKHEHLKALGVQHPIDYRTVDYAEEIRRITQGRGVDLALDPLGGPDARKTYELLRPAGHLIEFGWANMVSGEQRSVLNVVSQFFRMPRFSPLKLMADNRTVSGVNMAGMWSELPLMGSHLQKLMELAAEAKVQPHVDSVFPLSQGADAHRHMLARKNVGKVLLDCEA